jgi:subtilisin family serine protease
LVTFAATALAAASAGLAVGSSAGAGAVPAPRASYIVTLADGVSPARRAAEHGRREGFVATQVYESAIRGYAAELTPSAVAHLSEDPSVRSVVADRPVAIAGKPVRQPAPTPVQVVPTGISRIHALTATATATNVDVAVVDTGVGPNSDLNIAGGYNCLTSNRSAYGDANGHGTHVAGTIGAKNDGSGVVGVAPGARIWAVRVLDANGNGTWSSIICGIDWVTRKAETIDVANMSLGGSGSDSVCGNGSDPLHDAICRSVGAGVTYAVAAGNSHANTSGFVPGAYDEVITVSAMTDVNGAGGSAAPLPAGWCWPGESDESFAEFSNFGGDVDLVAPGVCITSTKPNGGTQVMSGTSMATPHVTGAAARYKALHSSARPADVQAALVAMADTTFAPVDDTDGAREPLLDLVGLS